MPKRRLPPKRCSVIEVWPTSFEDPRQQVIYEITRLSLPAVSAGMYLARGNCWGAATEVSLIGYFTSVSMNLAVYDVRSDTPTYIRRGTP